MALNISCNIVASEKGRELVQHGSALFPIACYAEDLSSYSVAWHWHEEFEYVLCTKGPLHYRQSEQCCCSPVSHI